MNCKSISNWIEYNSIRGRMVFTRADLVQEFPEMSSGTMSVALTRLIGNKTIISPWKGFYVIVANEYKLKGSVPPSFYIDNLMKELKRDYYVSSITAAGIHGAAHQRSQSFHVVVSGGAIRGKIQNGTAIIISRRARIIRDEIIQVQTQTGTMNVSSPLLTSLDLVRMENHIGGLSRVAEMLCELVEKLKFDEHTVSTLKQVPVSCVQRLGYILETVGATGLADKLRDICTSNRMTFRQVALKSAKGISETDILNTKWKLIINQEIEIDDL